MPQFTYTAIEHASGRERSGLMEGESVEAVTQLIKARGLAPVAIAPAGRAGAKSKAAATPRKQPGRGWSFGRVLSQKALAVFTRQLATLVKARMPILRSLEVLAKQEKNLAFEEILHRLAETVRSGGNLSDGLSQHPKVFDRLYVNMVKAGEAGGVLDVALLRLAGFLEKSTRIKGRVRAAMTYPLVIVLVAAAIMATLMVFVVPKFEAIFAGTLKGQSLPALTQFVLGVSNFLRHHYLLAAGLAALLFFAGRALARMPAGRRLIDRNLLRLPLLGDLFLKAAVARFSRTFGTLLSSGVPILQALIITRDTSDNAHIAEALGTVHTRVKEGDSVARPLEATAIFPGMVPSMIEVGEETGSLPDMLVRIADTYDEEVDNSVTALTSLIEPVMIVIMAVMVGTIVIALFLPIVRIIQSLG